MISNKILIIDDETALLTLLTAVFKKEGFTQVKAVSDSTASIEICRSYQPDIIILDIMMPKKDGFSVLEEIRKFTIAPVLFLSARSEETDKLLGLGLGADDYITKPFSPREVVFRVKAHLRRIELITNAVSKKSNVVETKDFSIHFDEGKIIRGDKAYILRGKEIKLLQFLVDHTNMILSKDQIIQRVWEDIDFGYENTLMVHISRIREKLEESPANPKYLLTVKGVGYKFTLG